MSSAEIRKNAPQWTLVLVRDLRHPPAQVWKAVTGPEHLREWAPGLLATPWERS
jgi:uncharacterized protein YndB with AHSA1/START domain